MSDRNRKIIDEFRANEGKVSGFFEGAPLLLLHHVGAKTGTERITPVMYQSVEGGYAIFASKAGADTNPDWFHNLKANPETKIEAGTETVAVVASEAEGDERHRIWSRQKDHWPLFAEYERKTNRLIPVVVLDRVD